MTGANRGIGAALLDGYESLGIAAMGTSRDGSVGLKLDVSNPDSISELGDFYAGRSLDLLVCNAGVFLDRGRSLEELTAEAGRKLGCERHGCCGTVGALLPALRRGSESKIAINPPGWHRGRAQRQLRLQGFQAAVRSEPRQDLRIEGIAVGVYHPAGILTWAGRMPTSRSRVGRLISRFEAGPEADGVLRTWDGLNHPL